MKKLVIDIPTLLVIMTLGIILMFFYDMMAVQFIRPGTKNVILPLAGMFLASLLFSRRIDDCSHSKTD